MGIFALAYNDDDDDGDSINGRAKIIKEMGHGVKDEAWRRSWREKKTIHGIFMS